MPETGLKIPNPKHQIPNKFQIPISNGPNSNSECVGFRKLDIRNCLKFGTLIIGAYLGFGA
jgi:hypothetical protein